MKENEMKTIRRIIFAAMIMLSSLAVADWTIQNELACDNNTASRK
jgi:hypothetical protein